MLNGNRTRQLCIQLMIVSCVFGCVRSQATPYMSWQRVQATADIEVGEPVWEGDDLRIPVRIVKWKSGDSSSVLKFEGVVTDDVISVNAHQRLVSSKSAGSDLLVRLPQNHAREYTVVYSNADGTSHPIRTVKIPERPATH